MTANGDHIHTSLVIMMAKDDNIIAITKSHKDCLKWDKALQKWNTENHAIKNTKTSFPKLVGEVWLSDFSVLVI